jgi:uncharacterized Zn-binding protein involved in type VI secretion
MSALTETPGDILDNYADAIEGGNSYRGSGTAYNGIPSARSFDDRLSTGETATAGSTTTAKIGGISAAVGGQLVRTGAAPYFLLCTAQNSGTGNTGYARKITGHDGTDTFTVAPAFAEAVANGDTFSVEEGFYRMRDVADIEAEDTESKGGHDRVFSVELSPGRRLDWFGTGYEQYSSVMTIVLRLLKQGRERTARQSLLENAHRMIAIIPSSDLRGDYVQVVDALTEEPEVEEDATKVVVRLNFRIQYRLDATYG